MMGINISEEELSELGSKELYYLKMVVVNLQRYDDASKLLELERATRKKEEEKVIKNLRDK